MNNHIDRDPDLYGVGLVTPIPDTGLDITEGGSIDGTVSGQTNGWMVYGSASRTNLGKLPFYH